MRVAVIGGGVAGSSVAFYLASLGVDVTLFEKRGIVSGPPMCHLHAGGNLYREISDAQCIRLLKESIEFARLYKNAIDIRPTIIATPIDDEDAPKNYLKRLEKLKNEYKKLVEADPNNKVLGEVEDYYKVYYKEDLEKLKNKPIPNTPKTLDDWLIPFAKMTDLDKLKYPIFLVQEYGINVFRVSAIAEILLKRFNVKVKKAEVIEIKDKFEVIYRENETIKKEKFDYVINSAGFESGKIDKSLGFKRKRFVEFKAAYVTKWNYDFPYLPEIIFHGKRGTPKGMAQFTPYNGGYIQLHGMTKDITLFENGLSKDEVSPKLDKSFLEKINKGWDKKEAIERTKRAINHMSKFVPSFKNATPTSTPLFGAQQIPGNDPDLRAAEVSLEEDYARCEIVKANSIFAMADEIVKDMINKGYLNKKVYQNRDYLKFETKKEEVDKLAQKIAKKRGYPQEMGLLMYPQKNI
ncbi:FAD-dependent oxidoreductase [Caminibacter mediatlanticus]|uniref:FAD dependent oxidoreductase domain-containing protein n=1 Tax=Caminibacter mediatlanticus TB-2 TaxID=391592 RepID=A0AAI9F241_9BACT|nr:FAD-dependent oxidoreductase [Caminibacter mediatlanticus]EDM23404.1 hypothetical protein CMTB2_09070 [Caminibacter mediatlanticus TB-2]